VDVLALCERFGCLPSQLFDEDSELLRYLEIEGLWREARGDYDSDE
jgi:hypothetical protein